MAGESFEWWLPTIQHPETRYSYITSAWRVKANQVIPSWITLSGAYLTANIPADQIPSSFLITIEVYDSTSSVSSALLSEDLILNVLGPPTPFFTATMLTEVTVTIGLDQDWTLPVVDEDRTDSSYLEVVLSAFTDTNFSTDLV